MLKVFKVRAVQISLIIGVALLLVGTALYLLFCWRKGSNDGESASELSKAAQAAKDKIAEANTKAAIEIVIARKDQQDVKDKLEKIDKVDDAAERRKQLLALYNEVNK